MFHDTTRVIVAPLVLVLRRCCCSVGQWSSAYMGDTFWTKSDILGYTADIRKFKGDILGYTADALQFKSDILTQTADVLLIKADNLA
jgi:hypothetical protein